MKAAWAGATAGSTVHLLSTLGQWLRLLHTGYVQVYDCKMLNILSKLRCKQMKRQKKGCEVKCLKCSSSG